MAATFFELHNQLRAEIGDYFPISLAKLYIQRAMLEISQRTSWSWLLRDEQILVPAAISGEVTVVEGSRDVVASVAFAAEINALTGPPIGRRQLRLGTGGGNLYEIRAWDSGTSTLTLNYQVPVTAGTYPCLLIKCYYLPPNVEQPGNDVPWESSNFKIYHDIRDKSNNFPIILTHNKAWLDRRDPRRDSTGTPTHMIQMPPTTAVFAGAGNDPGQVPLGTPRCELWPHPTGAYVYETLYEMRYWPLADDRVSAIPETLNPDLIINTALMKAYRWAIGQRPVGNRAQVSTMGILLADARNTAENLYLEAFREDKLNYADRAKDLLGGKFPYVMGAAYAQVHDIYSMSGLYGE